MDKDKWEKHPVSGDYEGTTREIERLMRLKESFDLIGREVRVGGRRATLYFVDGFVKDEILEKLMEFTMKLTAKDLEGIEGTQNFADRFIPYVEVDTADYLEDMITQVLSGTPALLVEGFPQPDHDRRPHLSGAQCGRAGGR